MVKLNSLTSEYLGKSVSTPGFLLTFGLIYGLLTIFSISVDWFAIDAVMFHTTSDSNWQILAIGATLAVASEVIVVSLGNNKSKLAYSTKDDERGIRTSPTTKSEKRGQTLANYSPLLIASIVYLSTLDRFVSELFQQNSNPFNITGFDTVATFVFTLAIVGICLNAHNSILIYRSKEGSYEVNSQ